MIFSLSSTMLSIESAREPEQEKWRSGGGGHESALSFELHVVGDTRGGNLL